MRGWITLAALAALVSLTCEADSSPAAPAAGARGDEVLVRAALLREINAEREAEGRPALRLSERLTMAAQDHAEELGARSSTRFGREEKQWMAERLARAGYLAASWFENLVATTAEPAVAVRDWKRQDRDGFRHVLERSVVEVGIGVSRVENRESGRIPLYVFLFAVPEAEAFARATAGLADLPRVRADLLERVNRERQAAGLRPLRGNEELDRAAQAHAVDMLRRSYFEHESPEGKSSLDRVRAAGYQPRTVAENIAEGQHSVDQVMDGWMRSHGHRANILTKAFEELGVGLAMGQSRPGQPHRVYWVQEFGRR
jgi:uncharacterized protein YkwD